MALYSPVGNSESSQLHRKEVSKYSYLCYTENGMDDEDNENETLLLNDKRRVGFFKSYLAVIAEAIRFYRTRRHLGYPLMHFAMENKISVEMHHFTGTESELKFAVLLFSNAPSLITMKINFREGTKVKDVLTTVAKLAAYSV